MKLWHVLAAIGIVVFFVRSLTDRKNDGSSNLVKAIVMRALLIGLVFFVMWLVELVTGQ